jgi:CubicO group peptidase (beta-lactamase class C family)
MKKILILLIVLFTLQCGKDLSPFGGEPNVSALPNRLKPEWPSPDWKIVKPESVGVTSAKLKLVEEYAFTRTGDETDRKGRRTDAVVILRNGKLIYEKYARNFTENKVHLTWSVTKSILQTMYGIAVKQGLIKLDDPGYYHYEPLSRDEAHKKITIRHTWEKGYGKFLCKSSPSRRTRNTSILFKL